MAKIDFMARQVPLLFLCVLSVAGCSPAPRYTLHEASEPSNGARVTLRIDTRTGEALSLGSLPTTPGGRVLFWAPVLDQVAALAAIRTLDEARKPAAPSQP